MGLLARACEVKIRKSGLLARAEKINYDFNQRRKKIDFFSWALSNGFKHCGIFVQSDDFFCLAKCIGIDSATIVNFIVNSDFFYNFAHENEKWHTFPKENLDQIFCFFSKEFQTDLKYVSFFPFRNNEKNYCFMIFSTEENNAIPEIREDFIDFVKTIANTIENKILTVTSDSNQNKNLELGFSTFSNAEFYILSLENQLKQITENVHFESEIKEIVKNAIFDEVFYIVNKLFQNPNCAVIGKNHEIKIVLFSNEETDENLLSFHIKNELEPIFENKIENKLILLPAGICTNISGAKAFLTYE